MYTIKFIIEFNLVTVREHLPSLLPIQRTGIGHREITGRIPQSYIVTNPCLNFTPCLFTPTMLDVHLRPRGATLHQLTQDLWSQTGGRWVPFGHGGREGNGILLCVYTCMSVF